MASMFGGNTPWTYEELTRKRKIADSLLAANMNTPHNVGEGLNAIGRALAVRGIEKRADKREGELKGEFNRKWEGLFGGMPTATSNSGIAYTSPEPVDPASPKGIANDTMAALGKGPVGRDTVVAGLVERGMPQHVAEGFAMNFADESAFNPTAVGDNGNAYGLAQWNGPRKAALFKFAEARGASPADSNVQLDFLMHELQGPEAAAAKAIYATNDPGAAGAAIVNHFERPAEVHRARREAAYTGGNPASGGAMPVGMDIGTMAELMSDPMASPGQKAVIGALLQRQMDAADPMKAMEMERAQLELDALRNPKADPVKQDTFTGPDGTVYSFNPVTGQTQPLTGGKPQPQPMTAEERARWGIPETDKRPYVMKEGVPALIGGNGVTVNNNMGGGAPADEEELRKKLGGKEGESWAAYLDAGAVSAGTAQDMQLMDSLIEMAPTGPLQGRFVEMFPGVSDAGAAFQSVVSRVAPTLRTPGAGATSDIEYDGMVKSLPGLKNRPEANRAISGMMKAKAQINMDRAAVVSAYQNNEISAADARKQLQEINSRSIMTPELQTLFSGLAPQQPQSIDGYTIEEAE